MIAKARKFYDKQLYKQAEKITTDILQKDPSNNDALRLMGYVYLKTNRLDLGVGYIKQAILSEPANAANNIAMAHYCLALGNIAEATNFFTRAYSIDNDAVECLFELGKIHAFQNDHGRASAYFAKYILIHPHNSLANQVYASCMLNFRFSECNEDQRQAMLYVLQDYGISPISMYDNWLFFIKNLERFQNLATTIHSPSRDYLSLKTQINDPFFVKGIERLKVRTPELEIFLTDCRDYLLEQVCDDKSFELEAFAPFLSALATQCWCNEYAFFVKDPLITLLERIDVRINELAVENNAETIKCLIYLYACYAPPHKIPNIDALLKCMDYRSDATFKKFVTEQILDHYEELKIRKEIKCLTPIDDDVSKSVQEQYEENPYPRRNDFILADPTVNQKELAQDILFAGCGTGHQVLGFSQLHPNSNFTGIDLSRASLAYAIRQARRYKQKIKYAQADILKLDQLLQKYDLIYCTGVLHHMEYPEMGLRALKNILKPQGKMRLALYSELGRSDVVAGRQYIAEENYAATNDDIRRFRHDLMQLHIKGEAPQFITDLVKIVDFYSLSECRDLLFHVQEHRYTIPQFLEMLDQHDLEFVSFNIKHTIFKQKFAEMFPQHGAELDPMKWHEFEQKTPKAFASMYDFYVRDKK